MDLAGRKVVRNKGQYFSVFVDEVEAFILEQSSKSEVSNELNKCIFPLKEALEVLKETTEWLIEESQNDNDAVGAAATDYLNLLCLQVGKNGNDIRR